MLPQQTKRKIIIIGGTGKQGSAVITALLPSKSTSSLHLLTLTRNLQSKKALELKEREVELVQTDLDEATVDQLANVFQGADGLFIAQAISDKEVEQGCKIINAAEKAGVKQVVYSSVCRAHDAPNVPHFHSKFLIEEYLKQSSIKYYTILRPFSFMENLFFATRHDKEKVCFFTDPQTIVNHIACEDIGKVAVTNNMSNDEVRSLDDRYRYTDVDEEPDVFLPPLPILDTGKDLLNKVAFSLKKCTSPKDGLTQEQSAALYLYSLPGPFYDTFNGALRNEDRNKSIPFSDYYHLFMSALNKLPSVQDSVWRGVTADLSAQYQSGSVHIWHAASSCTDHVAITDTFLDKKKHRTLFNIKCYNGKPIKNHSHYVKENELILPPGTCIRVISQSNPADNLHIVACQEVELSPAEMNAIASSVAMPGHIPKNASIFYLFWLDPNVNKPQENVKTQEKLRKLFDGDFEAFEKEEQCEFFIKQKETDKIMLIVSGQMGQQILPKIHNSTSLTSVKGILTNQNELINEVEQEKIIQTQKYSNNNKAPPPVNTPISGYEKQMLLPLEEALKPVESIMEDLQYHIKIAKDHAKKSSPDGLTHDESASIMLYTTEFGEASLYTQLNKALRGEQRSEIKPWLPYLKIFMTALHKLPSFQGVVWHAVKQNLRDQYKRGERGVWWGVSSMAMDPQILESYIQKTGPRTVFTVECKNGKDIGQYSQFPDEKEVMLMPGFYYEVTSVFEPAHEMYLISLKEIDAPW
ncbi:unnamed protein product [Adineta steineri]|uniref:NAD(P)(+)--arginine ADP-ribosyltransferase n=1 Tax=Adineta steineri TaxID=433720 RepID=A0A814G3S1_9BILA|nr:unnamed protein product [Adineta steineri]CAF0993700.1 unnamed protein product [Adineta steineri]